VHDHHEHLVGEHEFHGVLSFVARRTDVLSIPLVARRVHEFVGR
jgi:hypothetical protein